MSGAATGETIFSRRRSLVRAAVEGADGLLVTSSANVRYLTGFTGSNGWLLLSSGGATFLTDPRYEKQAENELQGLEVVVSADGLHQAIPVALRDRDGEVLGFEAEHVAVAGLRKLEGVHGAWAPTEGVVEQARRCKSIEEIAAIRAALAITEAALLEVAGAVVPGHTEAEIAADLERACRRRGADGMAFETIVASGARSSLPHGVAGTRRVGPEEPLMIDMGCRLDGYCSDLTRMIWCGGSPDEHWVEVHATVNRAREAALSAVAPGVAVRDVDAAAREVIAAAGYSAAFSHGTGHGVGLEIHEAPRLSASGDGVLEAGMVVTIEPGVYFEDAFGIRIEDLVVVGADGCERLTALDTEPILRGSS